METNSEPGKIHLSQATANELIGAGKEHWLSAREETISVKGKGFMQTYWVLVPSMTAESSKSGTHHSSSTQSPTRCAIDATEDADAARIQEKLRKRLAGY